MKILDPGHVYELRHLDSYGKSTTLDNRVTVRLFAFSNPLTTSFGPDLWIARDNVEPINA